MTMHEQVTVKVTEGHLERLLINNKWCDHGSPQKIQQTQFTLQNRSTIIIFCYNAKHTRLQLKA